MFDDVFLRDDPSDLRTKLFKTRMWHLSIISRSTNVDLEPIYIICSNYAYSRDVT